MKNQMQIGEGKRYEELTRHSCHSCWKFFMFVNLSASQIQLRDFLKNKMSNE